MVNQILNQNKSQPDIIAIIQNLFKEHGNEVEAWLAGAGHNTTPFFYNSVDLRNSGFKLAPVDTNLFPGGFNNLNEEERRKAVTFTKAYFDKYHPDVKKIIMIAEDHTRNKYYMENIAVLSTIITEARIELRLASFSASEERAVQYAESFSGKQLAFEPMIKNNDVLQTLDGFIPDLILINNDLTGGAPDLICDIKQIVTPPVGFGWHRRRKTSHFDAYDGLATDFCRQFGIDPWLLTTLYTKCGVVDFKEKTGIECVAKKADSVIERIANKYNHYGIKETPYVFIKSNRGTYGMGIMTAKSGDEILKIGKDIRKKMNMIKGGTQNTEVIIQEGIPTIDNVDGNPAEPMIYLIGGKPVGCIYRINNQKDSYANLNSSGMSFTSIRDHNSDKDICKAVSLVSRLAAQAAAWECYVESYNI